MRTKWIPCIPIWMLLVIAPAVESRSYASSLTAVRLRLEHQVTPLAVDLPQPRFQWIPEATNAAARGLRQTAYRILVASDAVELAEHRGDCWDSGKVASSDSLQIPYGGQRLHPHTRYYWKVQLWDQLDQPSAWSDTAEFTTGLPSPTDWQARWITAQQRPTEDPPMPNGLPIFRREFSLGQAVSHAVVYICGLGQYELRLNGQRVGDREMDPGWTNYRRTCLYSAYDVTEYLLTGNNAIGVMLGNGMYNVPGGRYVKFTGSFGAPKLILQMHVTLANGTTHVITSDATWSCTTGPITFSCIYGGEDYDARREQAGWDRPAFDASAWDAAQVCDGPGGSLVAQTAPPVRVAESLSAVAIRRLKPGRYEVDCGWNLSARPWLKVRGRCGDQVTVTCAEQQGHPWQGHSYTYTLKGEGTEVVRPRFTYFSFQYLYISGVSQADEGQDDLPQLLEAGCDFLTSSAAEVGGFECSDSLLNEIDAMIGRSVRSNLQSVLTDCPHREKLGWLEVSHLMGPSILYHHDAYGLYRKICRDTSESQLPNGLVPDIAPEYTRFKDGFFESAEWGSAAVQLPALLYRWYGDERLLDEQYETMTRYVRYLASTRNSQGLAKPGLGDWYDWTAEEGHRGYAQLTPLELPATAFLFDNARIVADAAHRLGRDADCREFRELAERVRADFLRAYFDQETGQIATDSQASLATALYFDLVPESDQARVLDRLLARLQRAGYRQSTGEVCFRMLLEVLARSGRSDIIYKMLARRDPPGYGHMLGLGFKTLSERWDRPGSSMNHCMFGHARVVTEIRTRHSANTGFGRLSPHTVDSRTGR